MSRVLVTVDAIDPNADDELVATLVLDSGVSVVVPVGLLPEGTREGDVLTLDLKLADDETERRRRRISDLQKRLFG